MTLEQMVNWIADRDHLHDGPKIIAALKAGQAMRDYGREQPCTTNEWYAAEEAWDAITKEGKA